MSKTQTLQNKKGEVEFRKKLSLQFEGKASPYPGEPSESEYKSIVKDRIKDYTCYFKNLEKQNIPLGPYLELGGGVGQGAMLLENKFKQQGFTCDISYDTLRLANKYKDILRYSKMPVRICADIYNLPFLSGSMPFIFTFQTLHHLPDPKPMLEEVKRVLAPGGYFYFNEEPIAQAFNLNLWRRDRNLKWFEKLLKATIILHFISRIGKAETDNDILEETFPLSTWEKALNIFSHVDTSLSIFPFKFIIHRKKTNRAGWIKPFLPKRLLLAMLGGGIEALCQTAGNRKQIKPKSILEFLACPGCEHKPRLNFNSTKDSLYCPTCKTTYRKKQRIYMLFSKFQKKSLYPKDI
jgi:SAM-dependent methyltransferase/uncharacterized protein YbaR (Trm112 family)